MRRDRRGQVAVVSASAFGPAVSFLACPSLVDAMRIVLGVYAESDGKPQSCWPRAIWIQPRAGQWESA